MREKSERIEAKRIAKVLKDREEAQKLARIEQIKKENGQIERNSA